MNYQIALIDRNTGHLECCMQSIDSPYETFKENKLTEIEVDDETTIKFHCANICQVMQPEIFNDITEHQPLLIPGTPIRIQFVCMGYRVY